MHPWIAASCLNISRVANSCRPHDAHWASARRHSVYSVAQSLMFREQWTTSFLVSQTPTGMMLVTALQISTNACSWSVV